MSKSKRILIRGQPEQRHEGKKDLGPIKEKNLCNLQLQKEGAYDLRNE